MSSHVRLARAWCVLLLLLGTSAWAQGTAVITGKIINSADKKPLQDAVVTATSPSLQGEQTVVSDDSGQYRIPQLPPGVYTLRVEAQGFRPYSRGDIQLRLDRTIRFNVEMLPEGGLSEELVVTATPPSVDVASSASGMSVDANMLKNLAVSRPGSKGSASRSFESLAELAPGAQEDTYGVSINGGTSPENQFVVDGLSVNDPAVGTIGTPLSVEFVKEVNVITGGYMPEYGRSTGGVLNVVTKSGSNEFHGSVFGNVAPGFLQTAAPEIQQAGSVISAKGTPWNQGDFGFELGGPILKDRLWFYAGVAPSFNRVQVARQISTLSICTETNEAIGCKGGAGTPQVDPVTGYQVATPIEGARTTRFADERTFQYIGKLTYLFNPDHTLSLSVYGTPNWSGGEDRYAFSRDGSPEVCAGLSCTTYVQGAYDAIATRRTGGALDVVAKQSSSFFNKSLLLDATVGWHHQNASILPSDGSGLSGGSGLSATPNVTWRRSRRVVSGKTDRDWHSITEYEQLADPSVCDSPEGLPAGLTATRCPVTSYTTGGPGTISVSELERYQGKVLGTYLLEALGHHVIKAGVDAEGASFYNNRARTGLAPWRESLDGTTFESRTQYGYLAAPDEPVFLASKEGTSTSLTVGGFVQDSWSILDKVTVNAGVRYDTQTIWGLDGKVGLNLPQQWSPRIGVIYDFTQQGRSKLFANYARFYENIPLDMADLSFPQQQLLSATYNSQCNPTDMADLVPGGDCTLDSNRLNRGVADSANQKWASEGGDRVPVDPNIRAQSSDEFVVGGEYEVLLGRVGLTYTKRYLNDVIEDMSRDDGTTFFLGNPGKGYSSDFPEARRDYDAVNAYYTKAFSNQWLAQVSYTWSSLRGNYSGLFRADTGQLSPNLTRDFDLLSLTVNRDGPLPGDRTHSFKAFGAKEFRLGKDMSLNLGGGYRARSGSPLNYLGYHPRRSGSETFILPRGSAGRLPWVHNVDGHLGLDRKLSGNYTLSLTLDVFNVFNFQQVTDVDQTFTFAQVHPIEQGGKRADVDSCSVGDSPGSDCHVYLASSSLESPTTIAKSDLNPNFKKPIAYQAPRSVRFGVKLSF